MKKTFFLCFLVIFQNSIGQDFPFSVSKVGVAPQSIIFIPGLANSADVWRETIEHLQDYYTCYSLTMAGFATEKPNPNSSISFWTDQIAHYVQEQNIQKPILVGHSLGGVIAMNLASDYPDLFQKLIIIDSVPYFSGFSIFSFTSKRIKNCSSFTQKFISIPEKQFENQQYKAIYKMTSNKEKVSEILQWSLASDRETFAKLYCELTNSDLREKIKNINIPTMVLLQTNFKYAKPMLNSQYKNIQQVTLKYAPKSAHYIMYDNFDWYINEIGNFIK